MSIELINAVWKHSQQKKSGALVVLQAIADYANADGIAWPAVATLARKTRMSKRNLQRWLSALQRDGELQVLRNKGRRGSNVYKICLQSLEADKRYTHGTDDTGIRKLVTSPPLTNDVGVIQSINESSIEPTPIIPKGDETDFWIKVCFKCFAQQLRPLRFYVRNALLRVIPILEKKHADSLLEFYDRELLDCKEPPYSSRKHSPERLILDLARQLAFAVQTCPPRTKRCYTIEDVWQYLEKTYPGCIMPNSLEDFDGPLWQPVHSEVHKAMRERNQKPSDTG